MSDIKTDLIDDTLELLEHYWSYRAKTPIDVLAQHKATMETLRALKALKIDHGSIGERLTTLLNTHELSVRDASKIINIPPSTLNNWMTNRAVPTDFDAVERLSTYFNVSFEYLLTGKE